MTVYKGKVVLITGGTGSFGRAFAKKLLESDLPAKVIIFSRDEWKQWEMQQSLPIFRHPKVRYFLGDIRDSERLARAFQGVNIVVHAAALKQVPAAEYNPTEFVKTNVMGAMNIIDQAINAGVERVVALSTDKAVNPVNLYGATKLCSDKLFVAGNAYVGARGFPKFSVVRYGNVFNSRGSIVPHWRQMIADGATSLPITHDEMTRFWITLDQSIDLVTKCLNLMQGGEIFVPKIPSIHLRDLATALAPNLPQTIIGIREGEKMHELMVSCEDARHTLEFGSHYIILPQVFTAKKSWLEKLFPGERGQPLPEGFVYASNTNKAWLDVDQIREFLYNSLL